MRSRQTGESLRALAERHGVNQWTFYAWHRRFKEEPKVQRGAARASSGLIPVEVTPSPGPDLGALLSAPVAYEVALRQSGHVVRVPAAFDSKSLAQLVATLEIR
tara:strand:+ start:804 stop:1115 length:312 start_codon:yes stop_codon:yes gene_type:complete